MMAPAAMRNRMTTRRAGTPCRKRCLRSEATAMIRRLVSRERDQVREHLLRLDDEDRRLRFGGPVSPARIDAHCAELDPGRVLVLSYLVAGEARGIGELRPLPGSWPRAAEAAISVERVFQGQGIGSALLRRLTLVAQPLDSASAPALPARQRPDGPPGASAGQPAALRGGASRGEHRAALADRLDGARGNPGRGRRPRG